MELVAVAAIMEFENIGFVSIVAGCKSLRDEKLALSDASDNPSVTSESDEYVDSTLKSLN